MLFNFKLCFYYVTHNAHHTLLSHPTCRRIISGMTECERKCKSNLSMVNYCDTKIPAENPTPLKYINVYK